MRDVLTTGLLTIAWTLTSFGLAAQSWTVVTAALPSLAGAMALHVASTRKRTPTVEDVRHTARTEWGAR